MKYISNHKDSAVSPVIGVILMVAITVILAAMVAMFVFNMSGFVQTPKVVAVTAERVDANTVGITYIGGQDTGSLIDLAVSINGEDPIWMNNTASSDVITVGKYKVFAADNPGKDHLVVTGYFTDDTTQVVLEKTI